MKFFLLRSGSSGNCTVVEHDGTRLLIDAGGFSQKGLCKILAEVDLTPGDICGLVVTHLHHDHVNPSTLRLCEKFAIPIWTHTANVAGLGRGFSERYVGSVTTMPFSGEFSIGAIVFNPFVLSHDAPGVTCGLRFSPAQERSCFVSYATDMGCFPDELVPHFSNASAIVIEANHDKSLLWKNRRRIYVDKKRVAGDRGHLSNKQSAGALIRIFRASQHMPEVVVLGHLSGDNNSPERALDTVGSILDRHRFYPRLVSSFRDRKTPVFSLEGNTGSDGPQAEQLRLF